MGLFANRPIALASGMGINAIVAYSLCLGLGVDWRVAMAVVFLEGILILLLVLCGLRKAVMDAIPVSLRRAIGIGIGLFIAFIGLKGGGFIAADESTFLALGDLTSPTAIVAAISIIVAVVLTAVNLKGALLISIVAATIIGIPMGVTPPVTDFSFAPDFSAFAAPFQVTPEGTLAIAQVIVQPVLLLFVFSLLMSDFFDTMGTVVAVGSRAGFVDKKGDVEDVQPILIVDSAAAPVIGMVTSSATCGALVVVGYLMMTEIGEIDWSDIASAFPAFLTIVGIPMTYSIANGIGLGFISYCIIKVAQGKFRDVKPLMWVAALAFLASFIFA